MVGPGMTVRKSVHLVFLRYGMCDLNAVVLVDTLSRTCFLPGESSFALGVAPEVFLME